MAEFHDAVFDADPEAVKQAWEEEVARRMRDLQEGRAVTIPWEIVRAELRRLLEEH